MADFELLETNKDTLKKVAKLLNTSVAQLHKNVTNLKKWMRSQRYFPEIMDDKKIYNFLILNKNNVDKTKVKIEAYYEMRTNWSDIYKRSNPKKYKFTEALMQAFYFLPLPKLTKDMCRVFVFKIRDKDLACEINQWDTLRYMANGQEIRLIEDVCYGDIFIVDGDDIPLRFVLNITPLLVYRAFSLYQSVFSMRLHGVYIINASAAIRNLLLVVKKFVKPKIFERFYCCEGYDFLKTTFENRILPKDYDGDEKSLQEIQDAWAEKLANDYIDLFDKLDTLKIDESLKPAASGENRGLLSYLSFGAFDANQMT